MGLGGFFFFLVVGLLGVIGGSGALASPDPTPGSVVTITSSNYAQVTGRSLDGGLVFVMFHAPWCEHCTKALSVMDELAAAVFPSDPSVTVAVIDVESEILAAHLHRVVEYPTFLLLADKKVFLYGGHRYDPGEMAAFIRGGYKKTEPLAFDTDSLSSVARAHLMRAATYIDRGGRHLQQRFDIPKGYMMLVMATLSMVSMCLCLIPAGIVVNYLYDRHRLASRPIGRDRGPRATHPQQRHGGSVSGSTGGGTGGQPQSPMHEAARRIFAERLRSLPEDQRRQVLENLRAKNAKGKGKEKGKGKGKEGSVGGDSSSSSTAASRNAENETMAYRGQVGAQPRARGRKGIVAEQPPDE